MATPKAILALLLWLFPVTLVFNMSTFLQMHSRNLSSPVRIWTPKPQPVSSIQQQRQLPMFTEKGGIIIFIHVAKTGGTTIRDSFADFPNVNMKRVHNRRELEFISGKVDWHVSDQNIKDAKGREKTMFLELHGGSGQPMTIFEIHRFLQKWRTKAKTNNKNFFVFTLVREPISFYVSYFKFFKHPRCVHSWCDRPLMRITERNLLKSAVPNHQCQYLSRRVNKEENLAFPVTMEECQSVFQLLKADLDWMAPTETMQDSTLPMLSYILTGNSETGRNMEVKNQQKKFNGLSTESLSEDGQRQLAAISTFDQELYDMASRYSLDMFDNFQSISR